MTGHEFRPQEVFRAATGEVSGFKPITEMSCLSPACFSAAASDDSLLDKLEEKVQILTTDASGASVVADIQGKVLFTEDGNMAGFMPPPAVMTGPGGGPVTFAEEDVSMFTASMMQQPDLTSMFGGPSMFGAAGGPAGGMAGGMAG